MCVDGLWDLIEGNEASLPEVLSSAKLEHQTTAGVKENHKSELNQIIILFSEFAESFIMICTMLKILRKITGRGDMFKIILMHF